jgi:hypothetical protein
MARTLLRRLHNNRYITKEVLVASASPMRLIKKSIEYCSMDERNSIPKGIRGVYVLYSDNGDKSFEVVYIGMSASSIKRRINSHARNEDKKSHWTHFSIYEVWDNIQDDEVKELEGLLRQIYRYDHQASFLNKQNSYQKLKAVKVSSFDEW